MKTIAAVLGLSLLASGTTLRAETKAAPEGTPPAEAGPRSSKKGLGWFANWKKGLMSSAVDLMRQKRSLTSVAAVRGAGQKVDDPSKPYLRGTPAQKAERRARKEREELAAAVDLVLGGDPAAGAKALDAFEAAHPDSAFLGDVKAARERLATLSTAAPGSEKPAGTSDSTPADQE